MGDGGQGGGGAKKGEVEGQRGEEKEMWRRCGGEREKGGRGGGGRGWEVMEEGVRIGEEEDREGEGEGEGDIEEVGRGKRIRRKGEGKRKKLLTAEGDGRERWRSQRGGARDEGGRLMEGGGG